MTNGFRKFLAGLAAACLALALSLVIIDNTLFSAAFVKSNAAKANIYPDLSTLIQQSLSGDPSQPPDPVQKQLVALISPQFVRTKLETFLDQLDPYLHGTGYKPALNLAELQTMAAAKGITVPPDVQATLKKDLLPPNALGPANSTTRPLHNFELAKLIAFLAALALTILSVVVSPHHWLKSLGRVGIITSIWLGATWLVLRFVPELIIHTLSHSDGSQPLPPAVQQLLRLLVGAMDQKLGLVALVILILGVAAELTSFLPYRGGAKPAKKAQSGSADVGITRTKKL
jgi:hypothetical protein